MRTRTYTVEEEDSRLPWQMAGEPDLKSVAQTESVGMVLVQFEAEVELVLQTAR